MNNIKKITSPPLSLKEQYNNDGFLVLNNMISPTEITDLINEHSQILASFSDNKNLVKFDTATQNHAKEKYFFDSARKISLFYEPDAFDENNSLTKPIEKSINKIGHGLHDYNKVFKKFSYQEKFKYLLQQLGLIKPQIVQSMYILKQPKIGNKVDIHQDSSFIYTEPETCTGLWFALQDANIANGCLWAIPGSHKDVLKQQYIYKNNTAKLVKTNDSLDFDLSQAVPIEVKAGTLVVLHGRLAHYSNYNHSLKSRHAYALHAVDQVANYSKYNWLQETHDRPFVEW